MSTVGFLFTTQIVLGDHALNVYRRDTPICPAPLFPIFRPRTTNAQAQNFLYDPIPRLEKQLLYEGVASEKIDAFDLIQDLRTRKEDIDVALDLLKRPMEASVCSAPAVLTEHACAQLRQYADDHASDSVTVDAMDGELEWRIELEKSQLESLIGPDAVRSIWSLPSLLDARRRIAADSELVEGRKIPLLPPVWLGGAVLRRYSAAAGARTALGFHIDSSDCTANICLSPPSAYTGGILFLAVGGRIFEALRAEGEATVHAGEVAHGVGQVTSGVRHSLLVFFQRPGYLFQTYRGRRRNPASPPA